MNIEFNGDEWHDPHRRKVVWFSAIVDDKCIDCGISIEALADHFGAFYDDPLPAFRAHRERIQDAAAKLSANLRSSKIRICPGCLRTICNSPS